VNFSREEEEEEEEEGIHLFHQLTHSFAWKRDNDFIISTSRLPEEDFYSD
jgi:hypothetical protein